MIAEAHQYLACHRITRREPLYSANRFARFLGDLPAAEVTTQHLEQYRQLCLDAGLSARTIESSVSDLIAVIANATGTRLTAGHRVRSQRPDPHPVPLSCIDAIWPHCPPWLQNWLRLTYWTGLRLADSMSLHAEVAQDMPTVLSITASKTGRRHQYPVPQWLRAGWAEQPPPYTRSTDFWRKHIRDAICHACGSAGVPCWTPKQLRQRAITEWSRANGTAGQILHGCGLGVLSHYLDPLSVLEAAAPMVRVPACFGATVDSGERLTQAYRRLDPQGRELILTTAERLLR